MDGSWLQLKLKRGRLQRRLHAHLTLLRMYYPWNQIKSILLLNIRITKQTNPTPYPNPNPKCGHKEEEPHYTILYYTILYYISTSEACTSWHSVPIGQGCSTLYSPRRLLGLWFHMTFVLGVGLVCFVTWMFSSKIELI